MSLMRNYYSSVIESHKYLRGLGRSNRGRCFTTEIESWYSNIHSSQQITQLQAKGSLFVLNLQIECSSLPVSRCISSVSLPLTCRSSNPLPVYYRPISNVTNEVPVLQFLWSHRSDACSERFLCKEIHCSENLWCLTCWVLCLGYARGPWCDFTPFLPICLLAIAILRILFERSFTPAPAIPLPTQPFTRKYPPIAQSAHSLSPTYRSIHYW